MGISSVVRVTSILLGLRLLVVRLPATVIVFVRSTIIPVVLALIRILIVRLRSTAVLITSITLNLRVPRDLLNFQVIPSVDLRWRRVNVRLRAGPVVSVRRLAGGRRMVSSRRLVDPRLVHRTAAAEAVVEAAGCPMVGWLRVGGLAVVPHVTPINY